MGFFGLLISFVALINPTAAGEILSPVPYPLPSYLCALSGTWHWLYLEHHRRGLRGGEAGRPGTEVNAKQQHKGTWELGSRRQAHRIWTQELREGGAERPATCTKRVARARPGSKCVGPITSSESPRGPVRQSALTIIPILDARNLKHKRVGGFSVVKWPFWGLTPSSVTLVYTLHCYTVLNKVWGKNHNQRGCLALLIFPPALRPPFHAHGLPLFVFSSFPWLGGPSFI